MIAANNSRRMITRRYPTIIHYRVLPCRPQERAPCWVMMMTIERRKRRIKSETEWNRIDRQKRWWWWWWWWWLQKRIITSKIWKFENFVLFFLSFTHKNWPLKHTQTICIRNRRRTRAWRCAECPRQIRAPRRAKGWFVRIRTPCRRGTISVRIGVNRNVWEVGRRRRTRMISSLIS